MLFHNIFQQKSINKKIRFAILLTTGLILLLSSIVLVSVNIVSYRSNTLQELGTTANLVALNSLAGLLFNVSSTAEENIAALEANDKVVFAYILKDKENELFASYQKNPSEEAHYQIQDYYQDIQQDADGFYSENLFFTDRYVDIFKGIYFNNKRLGTVHLRASLDNLTRHIASSILITLGILFFAAMIAYWIALQLQRAITEPIYALLHTMERVTEYKDYSLRTEKINDDETGELIDGFNDMLARIERRDLELGNANREIIKLNEKLREENIRMGAELEVTRRLQEMVLPPIDELRNISGLDISGYMEPADEVGGDYYDVIPMDDGALRIGIGDVTGHGLESGVLMLMVQTAVKTLLKSNIRESKQFVSILNKTVHDSVRRMKTDKNLTFTVIEYQDGNVNITGQHEEVLIFRKSGYFERINTMNLGFMIGVLADIEEFVAEIDEQLEPGDGIVLYTDGITEAHNTENKMYSLERLCEVISKNWALDSHSIQKAVINDLNHHMNGRRFQDDVTLVILKRLDTHLQTRQKDIACAIEE